MWQDACRRPGTCPGPYEACLGDMTRQATFEKDERTSWFLASSLQCHMLSSITGFWPFCLCVFWSKIKQDSAKVLGLGKSFQLCVRLLFRNHPPFLKCQPGIKKLAHLSGWIWVHGPPLPFTAVWAQLVTLPVYAMVSIGNGGSWYLPHRPAGEIMWDTKACPGSGHQSKLVGALSSPTPSYSTMFCAVEGVWQTSGMMRQMEEKNSRGKRSPGLQHGGEELCLSA